MKEENKDKVFQVEEIETISFDENGQEDGTWTGFAVTKINDPANYCYECRDKHNADKLCDFLNNECVEIDDSIDAFLIDNCIEWSNLITRLSKKERRLQKLKEQYDTREFEIVYIEPIDFKSLYGSTAEKVRKQHAKNELKELNDEINELELDINYLKRRIRFLRQLVPAKTAVIGVKEE